MSTVIASVDRRSPAQLAGIKPGEQLLTINGHEIIDVLDYRFYGYRMGRSAPSISGSRRDRISA